MFIREIIGVGCALRTEHTYTAGTECGDLKYQQIYFGFMDVILLHSGQQHVSATHKVIFKVLRTRIQT
jgi:hypothetical protein